MQAEDVDGAETALMRCPEFAQRVLRPAAGETERCDNERDEVLYVLEGTGRLAVNGEAHDVRPDCAAFIARGTPWSVSEANGLRILSVLVSEPLATDTSCVVLDGGEHGVASAGREFDLFAHPDNGCASVTQFVGHIPPGRAPDHYHHYDEVGYILSGEGAFHVGDESAPLSAGSCFHLPARLVHSLENFGPGTMYVLGVFRPAGSPAEAYYPDGTPAAVPVES